MLSEHGRIIFHKDGSVTVQAPNASDTERFGARCINPNALPSKRIWEKIFPITKKVYRWNQFEQAIKNYLSGPNVYVPSLNGYSVLKPETCAAYGVTMQTYVNACKFILRSIIEDAKKSFSRVDVRLVNGAVSFGVDLAIEETASELGLPLLGFSCPQYMLYVTNKTHPVVVGRNKDEYSELYVRALDLLVATGGRGTSLGHDIACACRFQKMMILVDVLNALSPSADVPAVVNDEKGIPQIENAVAAMRLYVKSCGSTITFIEKDTSKDVWPDLTNQINSFSRRVCRHKMEDSLKF